VSDTAQEAEAPPWKTFLGLYLRCDRKVCSPAHQRSRRITGWPPGDPACGESDPRL